MKVSRSPTRFEPDLGEQSRDALAEQNVVLTDRHSQWR
jgi:hypothetical protein